MKKSLLLLALVALLAACNSAENKKKEETKQAEKTATAATTQDVKDKSFNDLFKSIEPTDITESVFKLVGSDYTVITAGTEADYNSMVASFGGFGILFSKPTTWNILRANRYTLEYIKKQQTYTMAYFEEAHKEQLMLFGTKSGRNTDKMKRHTLTAVQTPSGSMSYKEAKLIIECKLIEVTTVSPEDFYTKEGKEFIAAGYEDAKEYQKLVFGEIIGVWRKK